MNLDDDPIAEISKVIRSRKKLETQVRGDFQSQPLLVAMTLRSAAFLLYAFPCDRIYPWPHPGVLACGLVGAAGRGGVARRRAADMVHAHLAVRRGLAGQYRA